MIAVAVLAALVWAERMWERSRFFRQRAAYFASEERRCLDELRRSRRSADGLTKDYGNLRSKGRPVKALLNGFAAAGMNWWTEQIREDREQYSRLRAKYERAALRPWLSVEPDRPVQQ
jgi:hypothetical protein